MLTRIISNIIFQQECFTATSLRSFSTSLCKFSDGDHTRSKAKEKAYEDLKTRREQRWLDTVASDSEAAVKSDRQHDIKQDDSKKNMTDLQRDTIEAVQEKERKGHMPKHDVGRQDTQEERMASGNSHKKKN